MITNFNPYPAMKGSGVRWLGEVPEHWDVVRLGQIGAISRGKGGNKGDEVARGKPCIRYGDLYTTHDYFISGSRSFVSQEKAKEYTPIKYGDVLFAASGETIDEIGTSAVSLIEDEAYCGGDILLFRPGREIEARFLGYAADCRAAAAQKATMGRGITVNHIYRDELKYLTLALPPLAEQAAIVRFLDYGNRRIRRYIQAKKRLVDLLEEEKETIIHHAVTRGLDPDVRLRSSSVEWIGEVPENWKIERLKRLSRPGRKTFTDGDWVERPYIIDQGVRLIQTGNIGRGRYIEKGFRYISSDSFDQLGCTKVDPNDVLICRLDGPVGRACLAPEFACRMITSVDNTILKPRADVDPRFVVYCLSSSTWLRWVESLCRAGGGFRYRISRTALGDLRVPVPSSNEQRAIADYLDSLLADIAETRHEAHNQISLLREYRTRLIADVVTGKLDVRDAAAQLPDVTDGADLIDDDPDELTAEDAEFADAPDPILQEADA